MAAEGADISFIQDEDILRRLWQQTEDFSKKKEIRARMYKLREQRLKEFYTTGEVLSDVRNVTPQIESDLPRFDSSEIITKSSRYTTSSGETMTHADSIKDQDFMAMKSKEIRDSESPTRDFQTYQETPQSYWKVQSSGGRFQAVGTGGQVEITTQAHAEKMIGQDNRVTSASAIASGNKSVVDESGQSKVISSYETSVGTGDTTKSTGAQNLSVCDSSKEKLSSEKQQESLAVVKPEETQVVAAGGTYSKASHTSQKKTVIKTRTVIDDSGNRQSYTQSSTSRDSSESKESSVIDDASKLKDVKPGTYVKEESGRYRLSGKQDKTIDVTGQQTAQIDSSVREVSSSSQRALEQKAESVLSQMSQKKVEQKSVSESASSQVSQKASTSQVVQEAVDVQKAIGSSSTQVVEKSAESVARESKHTISGSAVSKASENVQQRSSQHISQSSATHITSQSAVESVDVQKSVAIQSAAQEQVAKISETRADKIDARVCEISEQVARQKITESAVRDSTQKSQEISRIVDESSKQTDVTPGKYVKEESGRYAVTAQQEKIIHVSGSRSSDTESVCSKTEPTAYEQPQRATPIHHPQELQIEKGDVDYTTTYQSHFTPKRISVEVSPSHAQFASSLRAPSLTPERSVSPAKSITDRRCSGSRSPTKSISRGSFDRGPGSGSGSSSPTKRFSSPEPRRQSPTKDVKSRRSSTKSTGGYSGGYSRPISPKKHNNSPTEETDFTYRSKTTKEKRKFSSHSSRAATKKRSGTPGVSPSASPVPKTEKGRTTSSCSSSSYVTENETNQSNVQQKVTDFIAAERSDFSQTNANETVTSTQVIQTNDETVDRSTIIKGRDKSPEYSSDGSLVQELYLKNRSEQTINGFTPIKPSPDITSASPDKNVKAPTSSPSAPKTKKSSVSDSDDTDNVSRRKKSKPPTPVSRKSYSSRSSSVSPYSSPERKFPSIGASPDRERFPSSSPASSPERKPSPGRKTTETRPKKELTEFPSQRRFPEKDKKKPTPIPTSKKPIKTPSTAPKSPVTKRPSSGSVGPVKSPVKKTFPAVERKPSDKKIPVIPTTKKAPITPKSTTRSVAPSQKKPEVKKPSTSSPKKELTEYPSQRRFPEKEKKRAPSPPAKKSRSPVRSAFARTDSGKKQQTIISRNSDTKITTTVRKSSNDKIDVKTANVKTTRTSSTSLKDANKENKCKNTSANFIRTEIKTEVKQKSKRKNIMDYNWEDDKPPTDFIVDDSSSSRENLIAGNQKKKPSQPRTSSGPILKPKNERAPTTRGLPQQRSEPKLNITHTIASKIRAESRRPIQKTETVRKDSKTDVVRRDSKTKVIEKKKSSDSVTSETQLKSRNSKEFLLNEKNAQTKLIATVGKKQVTETRDKVAKNKRTGKKSESSITSESEEDVQKISVTVTSKENVEEHYVQQCKIDEKTQDTKVTTTVNINLLQQPGEEIPRSSRESSMSPDARPVKFIPVSDTEVEELRPRYADRVSEPDDDSDLEYRRRTPQKVIPEPVLEEEEEPKEPTPEVSVKIITQKFINEQVTDLDEKEIEKEDLKIDVSVAERVNQFMETARASATSPLPSRPEDITLKGLDDTINAYMGNTEEYNENYESTENVNAVLKAKSMFETIANTQASTVSKTARRELQRQDDIINRPSVFDARKTETSTLQQSEQVKLEKHISENQEIIENDVQVKEEIRKPVGKLNIDELAPKPIETKKIEVKKQIGKVNVSRFETEVKDGRDTFPRRKATSPVRETGKFDTFPSRKCSRKHSTDSERSPSRESSPADRKKSREESSGKGRKSPTKELTETPRKPSIPKTEKAPSKPISEKQEPQKPPKSPTKASSPERKPSPTRKDTPIANHISPEKIGPAPKNFKPVPEEQEIEHPKVNGYLPTDDVILPNVGKPTKIPEDSALKAPALLKKQVFTDDRKDEDVQRSVDKAIFRKDSLNDDVQKTEQVKISKFGVALRKTNSGNSLGRRNSGDIAKKESEIEKIFDLDVLESMLEKARGYEERRLIRQQIRIVRKMIENGEISYTSQTTTIRRSSEDKQKTERKVRSKSKSPPKYSPKDEVSPKISHQIVTVNIVTKESSVRRPKSPEKKQISPERKSPDKLTNRIESFDGVTVKSQEKIYNKQTIESENKRRSSEKFILDAQGKTIDVSSNDVKKPAQKQTSKTEIYITPTSTTTTTTKSSYSVNKTIKKSHIENETKETNLTDSITSSYGVGPTDEKGRPLFGLKALRRQNTGNATETESFVTTTTQETDSAREIKDSSGRALFGLKALKISTKPLDNGETMPTLEQPESPQLKEIVARHEKHARGNTVSQTQQQRPSARLRDSFIQSQNETHEELIRKETEAEEANRIMKDRGQSLRAMIQRHETLTESDKKKPEICNTSSSFATSTVVRSSAVRKSDGTVSVKKEVIEGKSVSRNGEAPITNITKTEYSYQTPEQDKEPLSITEIVSDEENKISTGKSVRRSSKTVSSRSNTSDSIHSRTSTISSSSKSTRKSPSPDRKSQTYVSTTTVRSSSKTIINDSTTKAKDETDAKNSRKMSDKLSQLSKKFSNDSIDSSRKSSLSERRESSSSTSHYAAETQSSINRSSFSKESHNESQKRSSITQSEVTDAERRKQSSSPFEDTKSSSLRKGQGTTDETEYITSSTFSKVGRGGSVKALSQKFQQVADSPGLRHSASMEVRVGSTRASSTTSEQLLNEREIESKNRNETNQGFSDEGSEISERRSYTTTESRVGNGQMENKSFIGNSTKVTGVQDLISRMRAADSENVPGEALEDSEARSLLNKFLGASVMMSGMEPLVKASGASSATLVSQVERQRILHSTSSKSSLKDSSTSKVKGNRKEEEEDIDSIWDERKLRQLLDACTDYEGRRKLRARLRVVMAERSACEEIVAAAREDEGSNKSEEGAKSVQQQADSETTVTSKSGDGEVTKTEVSSKSYSYSVSSSSSSSKVSQAGSTNKPMSPFAKFQQLDRQNSGSSSPSSPRSGNAPLFTFTDPKLSRSASTVKDRLLFWCQMKTKNYKNIQIENFSTSWSNGLAFCALIHHFLPESFDYDSLSPKERRKNFELAFNVAEKEAGICPLLDVDDMVMMKKPDWKCVFTYVQSIYLRFKDED